MATREILRLLDTPSWTRAVLVTLIHADGSTYQRAGARMIVLDDGQIAGSVAGGCLEQAVVREAKQQLPRTESRTIELDTTGDGDVVYGYGLGCAGRIALLLEPFGRDTVPLPLVCFREAVATRSAAVVATFVDGGAGSRHELLQWPDDEALPRLVTIEQNRQTRTAFVEAIRPPLRLVAFGTGPGVVSLARFARELGWFVTVVDHRPPRQELTLVADELITGRVESLAPELVRPDHRTAVVLMTHNLLTDVEILRTLRLEDARYVGVVGSRRRFAWIEKELADSAVTVDALRGPAGIDIGSESPSEIALSICAEITKTFARRNEGAPATAMNSVVVRVTGCAS